MSADIDTIREALEIHRVSYSDERRLAVKNALSALERVSALQSEMEAALKAVFSEWVIGTPSGLALRMGELELVVRKLRESQ